MEGRAIAPPNWAASSQIHLSTPPSMEGRAIARPNAGAAPPTRRPSTAFNGGTSNCPAKPASDRHHETIPLHPSMEGRAIARPNFLIADLIRPWARPLQWRAEQLPGQTGPTGEDAASGFNPLQWRAEQLPGQTDQSLVNKLVKTSLQWRAEQLPGQTGPNRRGHVLGTTTFNGGPSNCPAKLHRGVRVVVGVAVPSMEGRAIARPNVHVELTGSNP